MKTIKIVLPIPPKELSPNWRGHWSKKARAVKRNRALAYSFGLCEKRKKNVLTPFEYALYDVIFFWPDKRRRDQDNASASLKSAFDGIKDSGIIIDDDYSHFRRDSLCFSVDRDCPRVEIIVKEADFAKATE